MQLTLSDEQTMLRDSAHEYCRDRLPVAALRTLRDERDAVGFDREVWREMADMGWAGILIPEAFGGSDFGYVGMGQVLEAGGRTLAASPLLSSAMMAAPLLVAADASEARDAALGGIAGGERLVALALDELPRYAPWHHATAVTSAGAELVLNGHKQFVVDGHIADQLIVVARSHGENPSPDGLSLLLVDATADGITRQRTTMVDGRNAAQITFKDVRLSADAVLGAAGQGADLLAAVLDGAAAGVAAEMLGGASEAFDRTLAYLRMREQFDVAIGSFQALKHRAAAMYCELELTRSAVLAALQAADSGDGDAPMLASLAKASACETLELVSNEAVQMHGGIGMTDDEEIGLFLKRARVQQQLLGDAGFHRARYAELLGL